MQIRLCPVQDARRLAVMNKRLIENEQSNNPMNTDELEDRMKEMLSGGYTAYCFEENGTVIGYALVRQSPEPLYLRQFYIEREFRRKHCGREAFHLLMKTLRADEIDIDVLPWNKAGLSFWKSLGFSETCISMHYRRDTQPER